MIERFEIGKSYRWIGGSDVEDWSPAMRILLDGQARACIGIHDDPERDCVLFEGMEENDAMSPFNGDYYIEWCFQGDFEYFEEVPVV